MRGYHGIPMVKLDEKKINWLIKWKQQGHKNADIANGLKITPRRVQQIAVFPNSKNHQHSLIKRILLDYLTALQSLHYTDKLSFSVHESCSLFCET